jgi:hypothetical protein
MLPFSYFFFHFDFAFIQIPEEVSFDDVSTIDLVMLHDTSFQGTARIDCTLLIPAPSFAL